MTKIIPTKGKLLVKKDYTDFEATSSTRVGDILVPAFVVNQETGLSTLLDSEKKSRTEFHVISAHPSCKSIKAGDVIVLPMQAGLELVSEGVEYLIVDELNVLCVIRDGIIEPMNDWMMLKENEVPAETTLIKVPDDTKIPVQRAKVLGVGAGRENSFGQWLLPECKAGDVVFVAPFAGIEFIYDNRAIWMVSFDQILATEERD